MEKYGVVPPKFSKEWWPYFWEYYKIHTIAAATAAVLIGTTAVQCVNQPSYDLNILYVNPSLIEEGMQASFTENIAGSIDDITGDNKKLTFIQALPLSSFEATDEQSYAMLTKLSLELQAGESFLFVVNENFADYLSNTEGYEGCFLNLAESDIPIDEASAYKAKNGNVYAVKLPETNIMSQSGIYTKDLYVMVKNLYDREKEKTELSKMYDNSIKALRSIIQK